GQVRGHPQGRPPRLSVRRVAPAMGALAGPLRPCTGAVTSVESVYWRPSMRAKGQFEVQASGAVRMSRAWAMPNPQTFEIPPIAEFLDKYGATTYQAVVDPFS